MVAVGLPQSLVPMQPSLGKPFHRPGWIYEEKYDGWRMLAFKDGRRVRLVSRQAVDHTDRFRELAEAIAKLKAPTLILDGEICVFDKDLVSQFHLLDRSVSDEPCTPPVFMAFDALRVHGLDVRGLPLHRRRHMLEQEVAGANMVFAARRLPDHGLAAWGVVKERGYEGLVAKDAESTYRSGPTRSWVKVKIRREGRFIVGGVVGWPYTFAGLLVGQRIGRRLLYRGSVEWGLGLRTAEQIVWRAQQTSTSPFHGFRLSRGVTWLEPTLHVELTYSEIMEDRVRDPVYRGIVITPVVLPSGADHTRPRCKP
jgi:bifunctional non-homologous end joining protein LigD